MSTPKTGCCIICAAVTKTRCSSCAKAGIDIFFCSPAHQKLLRPLHRFFCGPGKTNPFKWPALSRAESRHAIDNLDTPPGPHAKGRSCRASTITEHLRDEAGLPTYCHVSQILHATEPTHVQGRQVEMTAVNIRIAKYRLVRSNTAEADLSTLPSLVPPLTYFTQVADIFGVFDLSADWLRGLLHRLSPVSLLVRQASIPSFNQSEAAHLLLLSAHDQLSAFVEKEVKPSHPEEAKRFARELKDLAAEEVLFGATRARGRRNRPCDPFEPEVVSVLHTRCLRTSLLAARDLATTALDAVLTLLEEDRLFHHDNSSRRPAMATQTTGVCLVCGKETKNRCSACAKAGIDLFFCSPEHQKLVWFGHKLVCGENAFPLVLPLLSDDKLDDALRNLDKPTLAAHLGSNEATARFFSLAEQYLREPRPEIEEQASLAHRFICLLALSHVVATCSPDDLPVLRDLVGTCIRVLIRFAEAHFGPTVLDEHFYRPSGTSMDTGAAARGS
ncbi:hypothetical protein NBRC10512v2_003367 [Rhodotorula toruloides]